MQSTRFPQLLRYLIFVLILVIAVSACGDDGEPDRVAQGNARAGTTSQPETTATTTTPPAEAENTTADDDASADEAATDEAETEEAPSGEDTAASDDTGEVGETPEAAENFGNPGEVIRLSGAEGIDGSGDVSGSIDEPGEVDTFTFDVFAGQEILVEVLACDTDGPDPIRADFSLSSGGSWQFRFREDDCPFRERREIDKAGTVTLEIGRDTDDQVGTYSFRVVDVTPTPVELVAGSEITPDNPEGAGHLEREGFHDVYHFNAVEGEAFVIEQLGNCDFQGDDRLRLAVDGAGVDRNETIREGDCREVDRFEPDESGLVEIRIRSLDNATTGTYSFRLDSVGGEAGLTVPIGDSTNPEASEIISGEISTPGEEDVFTFPVEEDQQLLIQQTGGCDITDGDHFVIDDDGPVTNNLVFRMDDIDEGDCLDNDWLEIERDGELSLTVRDRSNKATGTYNFRLLWVPVDPVVPLLSGDVVAPGAPAPGSGELILGQRDRYSFEALDDQVFFIEQLGGCNFTGDTALRVLIDGAGERRTDVMRNVAEGDCLDTREFKAEEAGTVIVTISDGDNLAVGDYSFRVRLGVDNAEQADVILEELGAEETDEGTVITLDETLLFDFGSSELRPEALAALGRVADAVGVVADGQVGIIGHTDSVGDEAANQALSEARAQAVADALADAGVDSGLLDPQGRGESEPVADNENADGSDNPEGRALNRRVEIIFATA